MARTGDLTEFGHAMRQHFLFGTNWKNLNHGSFGTYPIQVRDALRRYQDITELAPDKFMFYEYVELLDKARESVASLLHAPVDDTVFVLNATTGVNTVLRNLTYDTKDAIVYFDTVYSAIEKSLLALRETYPHLHLARIDDFPISHTAILSAFSDTITRLKSEGYRVRLAIFDTIVSLPGIRFPFESLVRICKEQQILSLIDGAHGVGHIPLDLTNLDADFFVSNCHKWMYTPRGCAALVVPKRNQALLRTTIPTSHGYIPPPGVKVRRVLPPSSGKSDYVNLFQFVGTADNSPFYSVPDAIEFREEVCGGEENICTYIRDVAQKGADIMAKVLGTHVMDNVFDAEKSKLSGGLRDCALANVLLPLSIIDRDSTPAGFVAVRREDVQTHVDWIHRIMTYEFDTRVLVYEFKGRVWTRVSGQIYLELKDFEWLGHTLKGLCERIRNGESWEETSAARKEENHDIEAVGAGVESVQLN